MTKPHALLVIAGELEIVTIQGNEHFAKFEGIYTSSDGRSVHLMSNYSGPKTGHMRIFTPDGKTLFEYFKPRDTPAYIVTVMDNHFLTLGDEKKKYVVTFARKVIEAAIQSRGTAELEDIMKDLAIETTDNVQIQSFVEQSVDSAKMSNILKGAKSALDSPSVLKFGLNTAVFMMYNMVDKLSSSGHSEKKSFIQSALIQADLLKYTCWHVPSQYPQFAICKPPKQCACEDGECYGLCGADCNCRGLWQLACGRNNDCCFHIGCFGHDRCCAKEGKLSESCAQIDLLISTAACDQPWPYDCAKEEGDDDEDYPYSVTHTVDNVECVGEACKDCEMGQYCGTYGYSYYWCYTDTVKNWDYCCSPSHACDSYGETYRWCYAGADSNSYWRDCKKTPDIPHVPKICSKVVHP